MPLFGAEAYTSPPGGVCSGTLRKDLFVFAGSGLAQSLHSRNAFGVTRATRERRCKARHTRGNATCRAHAGTQKPRADAHLCM